MAKTVILNEVKNLVVKSLTMRYSRFISSLVLVAVLAGGCESSLLLSPGTVTEEKAAPLDIQDPLYQAGVEAALLKAEQVVGLRWRPSGRIPVANKPGEYFEPGTLYPGLPYSSVKEMDKFVGQDVSFHTFLSAVSNPRSVLYTEVVNEEPYHGTNCAPYYGTVCSMSVNYVLGINAPYPSRSLRENSFMEKVSDDDIDALAPGDVLVSTGHIVMVVDVEKEAGQVTEVKVFENSSYVTRNREEMQEHWAEKKYIQNRYRHMAQNTFCEQDSSQNPMPEVCVSRGDMSVYRTDEPVVVNILDDSYSELLLVKDGEIYERRPYMNRDESFEALPEGMYSARLSDGDSRFSDETLFEVLDVHFSIECQRKQIVVDFSGNSVPATAVELVELSGRHLLTNEVDEGQNSVGTLTIDKISSKDPYYCKVLFQGRYGKIAAGIIPVE